MDSFNSSDSELFSLEFSALAFDSSSSSSAFSIIPALLNEFKNAKFHKIPLSFFSNFPNNLERNPDF